MCADARVLSRLSFTDAVLGTLRFKQMVSRATSRPIARTPLVALPPLADSPGLTVPSPRAAPWATPWSASWSTLWVAPWAASAAITSESGEAAEGEGAEASKSNADESRRGAGSIAGSIASSIRARAFSEFTVELMDGDDVDDHDADGPRPRGFSEEADDDGATDDSMAPVGGGRRDRFVSATPASFRWLRDTLLEELSARLHTLGLAVTEESRRHPTTQPPLESTQH